MPVDKKCGILFARNVLYYSVHGGKMRVFSARMPVFSLVLAAACRGFYKKVHMGLIKAPQVHLLREAGRSMGTDVSSALRLLARTQNKFKTNLSFMLQTNQKELIQHWLNS